jgi:hypothetical protein
MVQQFSVNGHGGKQYEFEVVDAKVGALADGENRMDSVTYKILSVTWAAWPPVTCLPVWTL